MPPSLTALLRDWHDFYVLSGTAAATLVGLMFVAASIGAQVFSEQNRAAMGAFISPTVVNFGSALFICILVMVPSHTYVTLALALAAIGLVGFFYSGRVWMQLFVRHRFKVDLVDRTFYALVPLAGYLLVLVASGFLLADSVVGLELIAAALMVLMLAGLRNAWDMTIWIVLRSPTAPGVEPPEQGAGGG